MKRYIVFIDGANGVSDRSIKALEMYIDLYKHCVMNDRAEDARKILDQAILRFSGPMIIAKGREG